jgi:site-specific recombinase XerD
MKRSRQSLEQIFDAHIQVLATTLRPATVDEYRSLARGFLAYLRATFPHLHKLSQLRRDPHLLSWFGFLCHQGLRNQTRQNHLILLRRLLRDLADNGHLLPPDLIRREDFPPHDHYLPRPLSPEDDQHLDQQLRLPDTLESNSLRLIRATGIRVGECIDLSLDCLQHVSGNRWALHVPVGKLHSERWVPVDEETRRIIARILELRALAPASCLANSHNFLLPRRGARNTLYRILHRSLADAAQRAACTTPVNPHRLRHSFATEMVRLGVSLPALMQMLGHKDIRMTLRYVEVAQLDIQREFNRARQNTAPLYPIPQLPLPSTVTPVSPQLSTIRDAVAAARHLLQLFRLQLEDAGARRKLRRLTQRLLTIGRELDHLTQK